MNGELNEITLGYGGSQTKYRITSKDVAEFIAERWYPSDQKGQSDLKQVLWDMLRLIDFEFKVGERIGFAETYGKNPEFRAFLLKKISKGDQK